ncbi:FAD-binding domain-containing protein [Aspergillus saccharolyticus JOP 1030-1]|uniref:FAD-binding domain-containing protein n=1 Tax=Aspergillus saccharolyticus JOP 1030-1 TaxID=1450539 RepID=A0A318Z7N7_9EURO|nr:FAD-binding domain-containing protein [Aspergillus saccharolyticus JOP 1030-1]PYH42437.1 FAD-binding domain-containing protein [Aspergillus saccharolyticus JOP 1030-1]
MLALSALPSPVAADNKTQPWTWTTLNATLQGRLHTASPLARPCFSRYNGQPILPEPSQCSELQAHYTSSAYRTEFYSGFMHDQNEICAASTHANASQCLLDPSDPTDPTAVSAHECGQGSVSRFYIPVTEAADVQAAFAFSRHTGVALSVKNSGHDYSSRSSLRGSLALWTRPLQKLEFHPAFVPEGCPSSAAAAAITAGAGINFDQVYRFAHDHNVTVLGGSSPTVGASGGFIMAGGHGLLSAQLGLGIDRVLEFKLVTPDGVLRRANACQNRDLFWALRGGGGGSFGLVLESTSRVEPRLPIVFAYLTVPANATQLDGFTTLLMQHAVRWAQDGWSGPNGMDYIAMANPVLDLAAARASLAKAIAYVNAQPGGQVVVAEYPDFLSVYEAFILPAANEGIGEATFATNRLIPTAMLQDAAGQQRILETLNQLIAEGYTPTLFATPPSAIHPPYVPGSTSATPAWRDSTWMISTEASWQWNSTVAEKRAFVQRFKAVTRRLEALAPGSGAYFSEADAFTEDWQTAWWGTENYARLLRIKNQYDPETLLRCWRCVGWREEWEQPGGQFECLGGLDV